MSFEKNENVLDSVSKILEKENKLIEKKLFSDIDRQMNLKELLCKLTREDMSEIAEKWGLGKLTKLNKTDYATKISEEILDGVKKKLNLSTENSINILKCIVDNNGVVVNQNIGLKTLLYYRNLGLLFSGVDNEEKVIVMPEEVVENIKVSLENEELLELVEKNDHILKIVRGILYNYGFMEKHELVNLCNTLTESVLEEDTFMNLILENTISEEFIRVQELNDKVYVCNSKLTNLEKMIEEQGKINVPYYNLSAEIALECGKYRYSEWYKPHMEFKNYLLNNYDISEVQAIMIVDACIMGMKDNNPLTETYNVLNACLNIDDEFTDRIVKKFIVDMQSMTRLWALKGQMISDLQPQNASKKNETVVKGQKTGRNEQCTCGSGKKFKKCCGKK